MQLFLLGFIIVEICEIFTVGGFPLNDAVRKVRSTKRYHEFELNKIGLFCGTYRRNHCYLLGSAHERTCRLSVA